MFASFAFPLGFDVAVLFWSLYAMDRRTVFPVEVDAFFPTWLNHVLHTNVAIFTTVEMIILHREYPSKKEGICGLMTFMFSYLAWMFVTRIFAGKFPYPIIDALNLPGKTGFFAFTMTFPILMYCLGEFLNKQIWSEQRIAGYFRRKIGVKKGFRS